MTTESLADPDLFRYPQILRAHFNQLQAPSKYAGNQCTSAALFSLVKRTTTQFNTWDADTMDEVLLKGTELHGFLRDGIELTNHPDMRVALFDLPEHVPVFVGDTCIVARGTDAMVFGQVARETDSAVSLGEEFPKLYHYLQNVLSQETSILVTVGEYSVAVAMEASRVWLFDSHSRNEEGMLEGDFLSGKACLLAFADVDSLVAHLISVYGRDQYCARSFNFYDLADDPVSPETHQGQATDVDEAENSSEIGEAVNSNQNAHTSPSQVPEFVVIGGKSSLSNKEESVASACLSPQTEAGSALLLVLQLSGPTTCGAVHWKAVQKSIQPQEPISPPCILTWEQWKTNTRTVTAALIYTLYSHMGAVEDKYPYSHNSPYLHPVLSHGSSGRQIPVQSQQPLFTPCTLTWEQWCRRLEDSSNTRTATAALIYTLYSHMGAVEDKYPYSHSSPYLQPVLSHGSSGAVDWKTVQIPVQPQQPLFTPCTFTWE